MKKIDLFIIGAPKSGTTWLESYFSKLDNVYTLPTENHFLSSHARAMENKVIADEFLSGVPYGSFVISKAVWYLYDQVAIKKIKIHNPRAKIIIIGREPYSLVHSKFLQFKFSKFDASCSFEEAWNNSETISNIKNIKKCLDPSLLNYKRTGKIGKFSKKWKASYNENVLILHLDDIKKSPKKVIQKVSDFVEIRADIDKIPGVINPQKKGKIPIISYLIYSNNNIIFKIRQSKISRLLFPNILRKKLQFWNTKQTNIQYDSLIKDDIKNYFSEDYKLFLSLKDEL